MPTQTFANQHIVVTGGTGALGVAVVEALLERGAWCHVPYVEARGSLENVDHPQLRLTQGVDLRSELAVTDYFASVPPLWASIHLAGGFSAKGVLGTSQADFEGMFAVNATTCFLCCREAVRSIKRNSPSAGRIVNVAARPALVPAGGMIAYSVSKSAVAALTVAIAEEVKSDKILVNAVAPSIIDTPANRQAMPKADYGTWPTPGEITETILFLASSENSLTSGAVVPIYGGA